jgi:uncharacterized surface protein with fasciclin (FAS1) repeats
MKEIDVKTVAFVVGILLLTQVGYAQSSGERKDILATAEADGSLNQFVAIARQSGMAKMFRDTNHLTVFAFTDQAFAKLPRDVGRSLMEQPRLSWPLLVHYVTPGDLRAKDLAAGGSVRSLDGLNVRFDHHNGKLRVQDSELGRTIICSNGMIHMVESLDIAYIEQLRMQLTRKSLP